MFAPPDRPANQHWAEQGPPVLIGFDFDCTLTVRHFFKVFSWGYLSGNMRGHPHCTAFAEWCKKRKIGTRLTSQPYGMWQDNALGMALEGFVKANGQEAYKACIREIFFGGEARIAALASFLEELRNAGLKSGGGRPNDMAIVTAGRSATVLRALWAAPELAKFFPPPMVWDVSQCRHNVDGVMATKALILREISPHAKRIILVDDSLESDEPASWVLDSAGVEMFRGRLPYEASGLNRLNFGQLWTHAIGGGSPTTVWPSHELDGEDGEDEADEDDDDDEVIEDNEGGDGDIDPLKSDPEDSDGPPTPRGVRDLLKRQEAKSKAKGKAKASQDEPMEGVEDDADGDAGYNEIISDDDLEPDDESRPMP